jgi:hypothetical protein
MAAFEDTLQPISVGVVTERPRDAARIPLGLQMPLSSGAILADRFL